MQKNIIIIQCLLFFHFSCYASIECKESRVSKHSSYDALRHFSKNTFVKCNLDFVTLLTIKKDSFFYKRFKDLHSAFYPLFRFSNGKVIELSKNDVLWFENNFSVNEIIKYTNLLCQETLSSSLHVLNTLNDPNVGYFITNNESDLDRLRCDFKECLNYEIFKAGELSLIKISIHDSCYVRIGNRFKSSVSPTLVKENLFLDQR